ncbi:MAG: VOC family protein [Candidatus Kerfeldbacteria bacterium]|nr:VOC family protein [Candidatus Kerfeldbacteria bacterium]
MIDHITLHTKDITKTKALYTAALKPLGYVLSYEQQFDGVDVIGFGYDVKIDIWFTTDRPINTGAHLAFKANSHEVVDACYAAAIRAGAKDNGAPGIRSEYHDQYYAAYFLDVDGNNIEVVFGN